MAITVINLSDPVATLVTKTNTVSSNLGDIAQLTTGDSNVVDAINAVRAAIIDIDDSSEIVAIARGSFSVNNDSASGLSLSYDSDTGVISLIGDADAATVRGYMVAGAGLDYDSSTGVFSIGTDAIGSAELKNVVTLQILDSDGTVLKTLYGAGT